MDGTFRFFPEIQAVRLFVAENDKQWYVIHTYSGHEERVKKNLEQRIKFMDSGTEIMQVVIPTEEEIEVRSGRRRTVTKKILPGYVLVQMKMDDKSWNVVRNTPGVTGFVGSGNTPTPLQEKEVSEIIKADDRRGSQGQGWLPQRAERPGDGRPVHRFRGRGGRDKHGKRQSQGASLLFGQETPVELDFLQIEKL